VLARFRCQGGRRIKDYLAKSKAPGVAVAFVDNDKACVLVSGAAGGRIPSPVKPDTIFAMGSVQKVFNSTLLAYQIVQGKANIDDPAAKYLVTAEGAQVSPKSAFWQVRLRHLVTHTSALQGLPAGYPRSAELYEDKPMPRYILDFLNSWKPDYPVGTRYVYSNFASLLVGHAAVTLAKEPYSKLLAEAITGPLAMPQTSPTICDSKNPLCALGHNADGRQNHYPVVGLWTTADDMLRFLEAHMGVLELADTLDQAIIMTHQELFRENANHAIGMAWEKWHSGNALLFSKNGSTPGFTSWLAFQPNRRLGVVVLSNGAEKPVASDLGGQLLTLAASH
jgi:CubicO group peptidase (beta-lactamase class C family)